jgi:hypothetical protein
MNHCVVQSARPVQASNPAFDLDAQSLRTFDKRSFAAAVTFAGFAAFE